MLVPEIVRLQAEYCGVHVPQKKAVPRRTQVEEGIHQCSDKTTVLPADLVKTDSLHSSGAAETPRSAS